ncbi:MAG: M17 family metallopeptidase, partial [Oscillospiraceae bacterium]
RQKLDAIALPLSGADANLLRAAAEAAVMAGYRYTAFLTVKTSCGLKEMTFEADEALRWAFDEGVTLGDAVCEARDLVNEPANSQTPEKLAQEAVALGKKYGFTTELLDETRIFALGMEALSAVSVGSPNPPVVIVMRYCGDPAHPEEILGLIGKGVTYDSGGLNLKSGQRFITMKHDMAGGGTVIGAICAIARQGLKANVTAVVAACENVISGYAYKPGDIIGSMAGKTIQINSTDAEGRLTLIDAICYAVQYEHVTQLVDIATLTGAARRILGEYGAPVLSNDDALCAALGEGALDAGELICRVPLVEDARKKIRGDVSDYVNTSLAETGGMVTAALFLEEFVSKKPWVHIDAAGPLWLDHEMPFTPKGGSGWGVRTLYHLVKRLSK